MTLWLDIKIGEETDMLRDGEAGDAGDSSDAIKAGVV